MSYGIQSNNEQLLVSSGNTEDPNQFETLMFCDFISATATGTNTTGNIFLTVTSGGGSTTNNSSSVLTAYGVTMGHGLIQLAVGTTSNSTGYASLHCAPFASTVVTVAGIPTPSSTNKTKLEFETTFKTESVIHDDTNRGFYRVGFMNAPINIQPSDGVYFEYICDGTTTDTTWNLVFRKDGSQERVNTGVTVSALKIYRMYLCLERDSAGTITTTYKIKNRTDNTNTETTAAPSNTSFYPSAAGDFMTPVIINSKVTTATTTNRFLTVDYIGCRLRLPNIRHHII